MKTVHLTADVPDSREISLTLPDEVPVGPVELTLLIRPQGAEIPSTFLDLSRSEFFGMWRDRDDIPDSEEYARQLRNEAWKRIG
jgi:hypothetical protein